MAVPEVKMKLLIDSHSKKVLFAEVGKECVDFLFYILSLPLGSVIRLLNKKEIEMVGCVANLYQSIENLYQLYLQPNQTKDMLLKPELPASPGSIPLLSLPDVPPTTQKTMYECGRAKCRNSSTSNCDDYDDYDDSECGRANCRNSLILNCGGYDDDADDDDDDDDDDDADDDDDDFERSRIYYSDATDALCPKCKKRMATEMEYVPPPKAKTVISSSENGGIVKGVVTYMVMDNLEVKPMSTISSITLFNHFNVKEVCALQEKTVTLTMDKALKLLKLSLNSSTVLTNVFLP